MTDFDIPFTLNGMRLLIRSYIDYLFEHSKLLLHGDNLFYMQSNNPSGGNVNQSGAPNFGQGNITQPGLSNAGQSQDSGNTTQASSSNAVQAQVGPVNYLFYSVHQKKLWTGCSVFVQFLFSFVEFLLSFCSVFTHTNKYS